MFKIFHTNSQVRGRIVATKIMETSKIKHLRILFRSSSNYSIVLLVLVVYSDAIEQYESNASNIHRPKLQTSRTIPSGQLFSRMNLNSSYVIETPRSNKITTNIPKIPKILNSRSQLRQNAMVNSSNRRDNKSFENNDNRVPFWNIAHMINSINQIELAIK